MAEPNPQRSGELDAAMIARSPIDAAQPTVIVDGWQVSDRRSTAALTIADVSALAKMQVKMPVADATALGMAFGRATHTAYGTLTIGSGPGEWLIIGRRDGVARHCEVLAESGIAAASTIDLTHGRALFRLTGDRLVDLMAKVCAIDLDATIRPNGTALRTSVASVATDIIRDDLVSGIPSMLLHCERSSGHYLFEALLDAGDEFDIDVTGFTDPLTALE